MTYLIYVAFQWAELLSTANGRQYSQLSILRGGGFGRVVSQLPLSVPLNSHSERSCSWSLGGSGCARSFHLSVPVQDESKIVVVPPFADSISEGDVRWEKGASKLTVLIT